jgi:hypothetical protein
MRYKWNLERLPGWLTAALDDMELPLEFDEDKLTDEQREKLLLAKILTELVEKGFIRPEYRNGQTFFNITEKGEALLKRYGRIPQR